MAISAGDSMQFVGSETNNPTPLLSRNNQAANDGHSGWQIDQDTTTGNAGIDPYYNSTIIGQDHITANWILLMAGTNDVGAGQMSGIDGRYAGLLSDIHAADPTAHLICASIIPLLNSDSTMSDRLIFNSVVQQDAANARSFGWDVSFADIGNLIDPQTDMIDPVHPNAAGEQILAAGWLNAIATYSAVPEPSTYVGIGLTAFFMSRRRKSKQGNRR